MTVIAFAPRAPLDLAEVFPDDLPALAARWPEVSAQGAGATLPHFTDLFAGRKPAPFA